MELAMKYHTDIVANKELSRIPAEQWPVPVNAVWVRRMFIVVLSGGSIPGALLPRLARVAPHLI